MIQVVVPRPVQLCTDQPDLTETIGFIFFQNVIVKNILTFLHLFFIFNGATNINIVAFIGLDHRDRTTGKGRLFHPAQKQFILEIACQMKSP
jgi:hypothetical protein